MKNKLRRIRAFAHRVLLELVRDPLSYVFLLGFPLVMLLIMTAVNASLPPEAGMKIFELNQLTPAISVFGLTFIALFAALLLSKDRAEAFLVRLMISPMDSGDFLAGYTLPILLLALVQEIITYAAGGAIALVTGETVSLSGSLAAILVSLPAMVLFIGQGLLIGGLLSQSAAPGLSSVIISAASLLGGIWMDVDALGGSWLRLCQALPYYHAVRLARSAMAGNLAECGGSFAIVAAYAAVTYLAAVLVFRMRRKI